MQPLSIIVSEFPTFRKFLMGYFRLMILFTIRNRFNWTLQVQITSNKVAFPPRIYKKLKKFIICISVHLYVYPILGLSKGTYLSDASGFLSEWPSFKNER